MGFPATVVNKNLRSDRGPRLAAGFLHLILILMTLPTLVGGAVGMVVLLGIPLIEEPGKRLAGYGWGMAGSIAFTVWLLLLRAMYGTAVSMRDGASGIPGNTDWRMVTAREVRLAVVVGVVALTSVAGGAIVAVLVRRGPVEWVEAAVWIGCLGTLLYLANRPLR